MAGSSSKSAMTVNQSNGSKSASTTGRNVPNQMEVDRTDSGLASAQASSSEHAALADDNVLEQELIPANSRLSRLPSTVPSSSIISATTPTSAISAHQNTNTTSSSHDVRFSVNTTTSSTRSPALSAISQSSPLETTVSSFTQPLTQHDLKHPIRRPRTSTSIFQSSTDLAAHYGIPQRLPPAPSTSYQTNTASSKPPAPFVDFQTLSQNYLNMLSNKPAETTTAASTATMPQTVSDAELNAPLVPSDHETLNEIAALLAASPEFRDMNDFDFMTSPMPGMETDFGVSPEETPYQDFLNTPLVEDDDILFTSPMMTDAPLFPSYIDESLDDQTQLKTPYEIQGAPYTISPFSPALESFNDPHNFPSSPAIAPSPASSKTSTGPRRTSRAIGIRKGVTPNSLLPEEAPTQPRKYTTPSATSKKEIPATFARKRARSTAFGEEEDQLLDNELPLNPTEKDLIEAKRRQNTVAARRSRKRKLEQYQNMEKAREEEKQLKETWKERANVLLATLREHGVNYPDFPEDVQRYAQV
ncbi:hypothetical protein CPB83DRAFT_858776 [Crepidotus variabilis]|uniref:BZIP domain-containing protein n=1 Tax=Crepidotus variabilis TaxID=179855 RepID=A0A9P6EB59_9AGAR|nr:hypothetical protein CPB83DRAFT_858776 [Crepidotus variabilis]